MKYCTDPTVFVLFMSGMVIPMDLSCLLAKVLPEEVVAESDEKCSFFNLCKVLPR